MKYFSIFNNKPPASWVARIARDFITYYSCSYYSFIYRTQIQWLNDSVTGLVQPLNLCDIIVLATFITPSEFRHKNAYKISLHITIFMCVFLISHYSEVRSSLIYNTSARYERHECQTSETWTTRVQHTSATQGLHERHKCDTSATRTTRVRHEWKKLDFDNYTNKHIFSDSIIYYMAIERLQEEEQFHSKYYLWECLIPMLECVWKKHHKNWTL